MKINLMQKFLLGLVGIALLMYAIAIVSPRKTNMDNRVNNSPTPTPTITSADSSELRQAVLIKSKIPEADFLYAVGINNGTLARGTISSKNEIGGAAWFAGKINGTWVVSYIGQGIPNCSEIAGINYPTTWISHCMEGNKTIKR